MYNFHTGGWKTIADYPFGSKQGLVYYDMLYLLEILSYFVIGGYSGFDGSSGGGGSSVSQIAKLTNGAWSDAGKLKKARKVSLYKFVYQNWCKYKQKKDTSY